MEVPPPVGAPAHIRPPLTALPSHQVPLHRALTSGPSPSGPFALGPPHVGPPSCQVLFASGPLHAGALTSGLLASGPLTSDPPSRRGLPLSSGPHVGLPHIWPPYVWSPLTSGPLTSGPPCPALKSGPLSGRAPHALVPSRLAFTLSVSSRRLTRRTPSPAEKCQGMCTLPAAGEPEQRGSPGADGALPEEHGPQVRCAGRRAWRRPCLAPTTAGGGTAPARPTRCSGTAATGTSRWVSWALLAPSSPEEGGCF